LPSPLERAVCLVRAMCFRRRESWGKAEASAVHFVQTEGALT